MKGVGKKGGNRKVMKELRKKYERYGKPRKRRKERCRKGRK